MPVKLIRARRFSDNRGWFSETYVKNRWDEAGISERFVQDNQSFSQSVFTLRGIHFQTPPREQAKLVRCVRGRILDVAVDLRRDSPTFAKHVSVELTAHNDLQLYIPAGFGHAFLALEPECELSYKVTDYYAPEQDAGIRWDCPDLAINWPLQGHEPVLSPKDLSLPSLAQFESPFVYDGEPLAPLSA